MSRADRPAPAPDAAPSSAGARRTARGIRDSDTVPPARATGGSPLGLPPGPAPEARTRWRRMSTGAGSQQGRRYVCPSRTPPAQLPHLGKLQEAFGLEPLQQLPALVVLQPSIGPLPLQQLADGARDLGHAEGGKLARDLAHQLQFLAAERASAKGQGFRHASRRMARFSPRRAQCPGSRCAAHATASRSA